MKKLTRLLALVAAFFTLLPLGLSAQTQDDALYVYRNDGDFTAFLREEIDSIVLSHYDLDSLYHTECVTQVFYTPDSIYRIPVAAIDSVSLVPIETQFNEKVVRIDEWIPYLTNIDSTRLALTFSSALPFSPHKGDVLFYDTFNDDFPIGFAGKVVEISKNDGTTVICDSATIDDVYEQMLIFGYYNAADDSTQTAQSPKFQRASIHGGVDKSVKVSVEGIKENGASASGSVEAAMKIRVAILKKRKDPFFAKITVGGGFSLGLELALENEYLDFQLPSEKNFNKHLSHPIIDIPIPHTLNQVHFKLRAVALLFKANAKAKIKAGIDANISTGFNIIYKNGEITYEPLRRRPSASLDATALLEGDVFLGARVYPYLTGVGNMFRVGVKIDVGPRLEGNAYVNLSDVLDENIYNSLKDGKIELQAGAYLSAEAGFKFLNFEKTKASENFNIFKTVKEWHLLPEFSTPQYTKGNNNATAIITTDPSRNLLMPVGLGIGLENEDGEKIATQWSTVEYKDEAKWPLKGLSQSFSNLAAGAYTAYPYVRILGKEMRAMPSTDFNTQDSYKLAGITGKNLDWDFSVIYDENGRVKETYLNDDDDITRMYFTYDDSGILTSIKHWDVDEWLYWTTLVSTKNH